MFRRILIQISDPIFVLSIVFILSLLASNTYWLAGIGAIIWIPFLSFILVHVLDGGRVTNAAKAIKKNGFVVQKEMILVSVFITYAFLTLLWCDKSSNILLAKELARLFISLGFVFSFSVLRSKCRDVRELEKVIVVGLLVAGLWIIIRVINSYLFGEITHFRQVQFFMVDPGIFYHHSPIGWLYVLGVILILPVNFEMLKSQLKPINIFITIIFVLILVLSQSRGAYLGLCVALSILYFETIKKHLVRFVLGTLFLLSLLVYLYVYSDFFLLDSLVDRGDSNRWYIWRQAFEVIQESLLFGHGFSSDPVLTGWNDFVHNKAMHFHSLYLSVLYYGGVVGFLLLLGLIFLVVIQNYRIIENRKWLSIFIMGSVVFTIDGNHLFSYPSAELYVFFVPIFLMFVNRFRYGRIFESNN